MTAWRRDEAGTARGKATLVCLRWRQPPLRNQRPVLAIGGFQDHESAIYLIAVDQSTPAIPEIHAVVERRGIGVLELQRPAGAAVGGAVNARECAIAGTQQPCGVGAQGVDIAKLQRVAARHPSHLPGEAGVEGARPGATLSAQPDHAVIDRAHRLEQRRRAARLGLARERGPRNRCRRLAGSDQQHEPRGPRHSHQ